MRRYFRKGRHRQNGSRPTVTEISFEVRRMPLAELFELRNQVWETR